MQKREAEWILKEKYQGVMTPEAVLDIAKLKQGEHVDYIIGFTEFLGCKIDLSKRPMIPRPETEYWVEKAIQELWKSRSASVWCLDLFAGSGCIGIAVLGHIPFARVDFGEKEKKFADQIKINATLNRIDRKRYRVFQSDVFSKIPYKYDYIFANPP
ncbi:MAG: methyltransferase, partial [Candidatus Wildermuthbacteria bacterium]|nr:methyltransferase [Candidatus Wildermuthbacteria bacterium]